jgi:hypothetical protein
MLAFGTKIDPAGGEFKSADLMLNLAGSKSARKF